MKTSSRTERPPAARSRVIAVLRLALPLTALAMLSTVFLVASPVDPNRALQTAEIDVAERARDPRLSGASFSGVTADGAALRVTAATARTDPNAVLRFQVTDLNVSLDGGEGQVLTARADSGAIDRGAGRFSLTGAVDLTAAPGYALSAQNLSGLLDSTYLIANGPVRGSAPFGDIDAAQLLVRRQLDTGHHILVFSGGVRVLYLPQTNGGFP